MLTTPGNAGTSTSIRDGQDALFLDALRAAGPAAQGGSSDLYAGLIGDWDADVVDHLPGGDRRASAEMHFAWVLEGRAVQDLWISPARKDRDSSPSPAGAGKDGNRYGTTLRVYDPEIDAWRMTWWNPVSGVETRLVGRRVGSQIVQTGSDANGNLVRWVFVELTPDRFHWKGEASADGGLTWSCQTEYFARRRGEAAARESTAASATFDRLTSLVGEWKGAQEGIEGSEIDVTYTLTANGSALMEEFRPRKGSMMITMFTVDGDRLLAAHYCSARNQPQMATEPIADPAAKNIAFSLVRVTGLTSPGDWHNTGLVVKMEDADHLSQDWTFVDNGTAGNTSFHFTRKR